MASPPTLGSALRESTVRSAREPVAQTRYVLRWLALVLPVALAIGSAVAFFLWALGQVTALRLAHPWLLWWLPVGGVVVASLYQRYGGNADRGNTLIVEELHEPGAGVPGRMAPLVLLGTLVTHLLGGSAGREGTAVQMGGSIASTIGRTVYGWLPGSGRLSPEDQRDLLQAGLAAGFGAVFGTPITGAIFAVEVLAIGRLSYAALVPCLMAALIGDWTTLAWGTHHLAYPMLSLDALGVGHLDPLLFLKVAVAAAAFGLASRVFAEGVHLWHRMLAHRLPRPWTRPALGGVVVIALTLVVGSRDYLGLGDTSPDPQAVTIASSFVAGGAMAWSWLLKLVFTVITVGSGFRGGEVTPLFFVGAALGNVLAGLLHAPVALFAGLGFVAVFAGAANTPLACTIMGLELFGADAAAYFATACFIAYLFSGHRGIYVAQRADASKGGIAARGAGNPT